ncbi:MAG: family 16 glycosylhydrolase [Gammaproteobacteria bacterium]|nr:family 16 glycosylhydrolase [Gammaproteobacteria bacterium]
MLVLASCGEGDGKAGIPATTQTGVLLDAPVSGVFFESRDGVSGLTDNAGQFDYLRGDRVRFWIGDIELGSAFGAPFITPVELTGSADPSAQAVVNQLIFLQSIDEDENLANGISVSASARSAAAGQTLDFESATFLDDLDDVVAAIAPGNIIVSDIDALAHFYQSYAAVGCSDTLNFQFPGFPACGTEFELIFADEFSGPNGSQPDPSIWNYDRGYGPNNFGWGNNEWQLYTDSPDNVRIEDGNLVITALCPQAPCGVRDGSITSARLTTNDNFEFRYGKIVARIRPPTGQGTWPAFWALGANFVGGSSIPNQQWPRVGEIDFMEVFNNTYNSPAQANIARRSATSAMHWCDERLAPDPNSNCFVQGGRLFVSDALVLDDPLDQDFQIWEANWTEDEVTVAINGTEYFQLDIDPSTMEEFRREFFLLLNVAVGGTLGSGQAPPQGDETFPQTMLVDYVRVFQEADDGPDDPPADPPVLTLVSIFSNNADPTQATAGDTVTIAIIADRPLIAPSVTIGGQGATGISGGGTVWQISRTLDGSEPAGELAFTIDFSDLDQVAGEQVTATTNGSSINVIVP